MVPAGVPVLRISEINSAAGLLLEESLGSFWLRGEISNWKPASSGHIYFALKEGAASRIDAAMWRTYAARLPAGVPLKDGVEVVAYGHLSIYAPQGRYQFLAERISPVGVGSAEEALRRLKEKLQARGYFAPDRKRPIPAFPQCIAVVTSPNGAAIRDVLETLVRRWPLADVLICPVRVQGDGAAQDIVAALDQLNHLQFHGSMKVDVVIVGRGGGSAEDLSAFNDELVAEAVFRSRIPVVSAVGHETDTTIADMVADRRAITPTDAAKECVPDAEQLSQWIVETHERMREALLRQAEDGRRRLVE